MLQEIATKLEREATNAKKYFNTQEQGGLQRNDLSMI